MLSLRLSTGGLSEVLAIGGMSDLCFRGKAIWLRMWGASGRLGSDLFYVNRGVACP